MEPWENTGKNGNYLFIFTLLPSFTATPDWMLAKEKEKKNKHEIHTATLHLSSSVPCYQHRINAAVPNDAAATRS